MIQRRLAETTASGALALQSGLTDLQVSRFHLQAFRDGECALFDVETQEFTSLQRQCRRDVKNVETPVPRAQGVSIAQTLGFLVDHFPGHGWNHDYAIVYVDLECR